MKLWCFLHAFQKSPYRYLYLSQVLEALEHPRSHSGQLDDFFAVLSEKTTSHHWWHELDELRCKIQNEEEPQMEKADYRFVFYAGPQFPTALMKMSNPPLALSVEGKIENFQGLCLSVVGSREPHESTQAWMQREFFRFQMQYHLPIVSGGARGVDQLSHQLAILTESPTAVVLPSGLSQKYPQFWSPSKEWVSKGVCFISEMPLAAKISKANFSCRNRIIAGWGKALLVAEAREKSGTMMTAHHALIESKDLGVIPGHPTQISFRGSLDLLRHGGQLIRDASDLSHLFLDSFNLDQLSFPQIVNSKSKVSTGSDVRKGKVFLEKK